MALVGLKGPEGWAMGFLKFSFIGIQKCHKNILDPKTLLAPEKVGRQL